MHAVSQQDMTKILKDFCKRVLEVKAEALSAILDAGYSDEEDESETWFSACQVPM